MKRFLFFLLAIVVVCFALIGSGSCYLLGYALEPKPDRADTARYFQRFSKSHPEAEEWLDSLRACNSFRDTFVVMPSGERHHAYYVRHSEGAPVAIVLHGWRGCAIDFLNYGYIYHRQLQCNILLPDLHAHGLS